MVDSGIILLKYWLEVSREEQSERIQMRMHDGRKTWKLSPMDLKSYGHWFDYHSRAHDAMILATDTAWAPWYLATPMTRSAAGSTSAICWHRSPTSPKHRLTSSFRAVRRPTVTRSLTTRSD